MAMAVSNQQSRDAALLRATTELFALGSKHDVDEIRRFEELATHFLGKVSSADRAFVAERLAKAKDAPPSVLRMLGKDLIEIAQPVLRRSESLSEIDLLSIISSTGPAHHRQIAQRGTLPAPVVAALRLAGDPQTISLLAAYPESQPATPRAVEPPAPRPEPAPLPARAARAAAPLPAEAKADATEPKRFATAGRLERDPGAREVFATARAMTAALSLEMETFSIYRPGERKNEAPVELPEAEAAAPQGAAEPPIPVTEPAPLAQTEVETVAPAAPVAADETRAAPTESPAEERAAKEPSEPAPEIVSTSVAPEAIDPLADFLALDARGRLDALARLCGRVGPADPGMTVLDADSAFRVALGSARVSQSARRRQREALIRALADGLKLDTETVTAITDDPSGEALVVLLRAIGLAEAETHQVLLFANPTVADAVDTFFRLARLGAEVGRDAAEKIVAGWRGEASTGRTGHQPLFADMELRRGSHAGHMRAPETAGAVEAERRTAG